MSLNKSIVEDAALTWFGELGYAVGHRPQIAPGEPNPHFVPELRDLSGHDPRVVRYGVAREG